MKDGATLEFPGLRLQVLETPGHTIESISILAFDLKKDSANPCAVLTGDTLFIGDAGRPDLRASLGWTADELGAHTSTPRCTTSSCRFPTRPLSIRPMALAPCVGSSFPPIQSLPLETNGV